LQPRRERPISVIQCIQGCTSFCGGLIQRPSRRKRAKPQSSFGCVRSTPASRTSVFSNSVTVITPGTGCSMTSMMVVSITGMPCGRPFFRETFFTLVRLGFAKRFFDIGLAVDCFAAFPRTGLEALWDLPRTADRFLRDASCFFRWAMVPACAVHLKRVLSTVLAEPRRKQACCGSLDLQRGACTLCGFYANLRYVFEENEERLPCPLLRPKSKNSANSSNPRLRKQRKSAFARESK